MLNNKKAAVIILSVFVGLIFGLVIASNLSLTQNGFAGDDSNTVETSVASATIEPVQNVNSDLESTSRAFVEIAKRVTPAVVSITSEKMVKVKDPFSNFLQKDDFFRRFFRTPDGGQEYKQRGLGSGVIVSPDGYILTNYHVIKDADEIDVKIDRKSYDAKIIGTDPATDIAVIKIDEQNLTSVSIGNSDKIEVGEWVLAIGSPFDLRLQHTVTSGIISAKGRTLNLSGELTYQDFIQTDAAINPGNSGGALVNVRGELIGINTAIYAGNSGGNIGIGFAVPINLAKNVMDDLISHGEVVRGYLGVFINNVDAELSEALKIDDNEGAVVTQVVEGTPAAKAGLEKYDVIVGVDGRKIPDSQTLTNIIASYKPDEVIKLTVIRKGREKSISVKLEKRPGDDNNLSRPSISSSDESVLDKLGLTMRNLTSDLAERYGYADQDGVIITGVKPNSPAAEKGMQHGDLIVEVDRKRVKNVRDIKSITDGLSPESIVLFQVKRGRNNHFIAMKVPK